MFKLLSCNRVIQYKQYLRELFNDVTFGGKQALAKNFQCGHFLNVPFICKCLTSKPLDIKKNSF